MIRSLFFIGLMVVAQSTSGLAQNSNDLNFISLGVMNYAENEQVQRYKKLELGLDIHGELLERIKKFLDSRYAAQVDPLNPFIEWDVDVEVVFTHESGLTKKRDGFFYQEYQRNEQLNDWTALKENPSPFRIRFAPPLNGKWVANASIKYVVNRETKEYKTVNLPELSFEVTESGHPGYVSVHPNRKNLVRGGEIIFPIGHNMAGPYVGVNVWDARENKTNKAADLKAWKIFQEDMKNYVAAGADYVKLIQFAFSSLIEFEEKGNYYNRLHYAWEQDKLIDLCEENDVLIHFNLLFQEPIMRYGQYNTWMWDFGNYNPDGSIDSKNRYPNYAYYDREGKQPYEMFTDEEDLSYHKQRTRYYIARYGYSPQIYEWELISEPWHLNETYREGGVSEVPFLEPNNPQFAAVRKALLTYNDVISTYIKQELAQTEQLVGITISGLGWYDVPSLLDESIHLKHIDLIGLNPYSDSPDKLLAGKAADNNRITEGENSVYRSVNFLHESCGKPVVFSEAGHEQNVCSNYIGHYLDVMTAGFTGVAGFYMWSGYWYGPGLFDERQLWQSTVRAEKHMNGAEMKQVLSSNNGTWIQGRQHEKHLSSDGKKAKETHYYVAGDKSMAAGFVRNRTYNIKTATPDQKCEITFPSPWDNLRDIRWEDGKRKLIVSGLAKKKSYAVAWYSYKTGNYLFTDQVKANRKGNLVLHFPELKVALSYTDIQPVVWFVAKEQ